MTTLGLEMAGSAIFGIIYSSVTVRVGNHIWSKFPLRFVAFPRCTGSFGLLTRPFDTGWRPLAGRRFQ